MKGRPREAGWVRVARRRTRAGSVVAPAGHSIEPTGGYPWITVPLSPRMASGAFSSEQITARRPGPLAANSIAA
ncbi:hypothetical protein BH11ACT1_BH11ACT1_25000 [soil metagenome]